MAEPTNAAAYDDPPDLTPGASGAEVRCAGGWVLRAVPDLERRLLGRDFPGSGPLVLEAAGVTAMDTAGAWLLARTTAAIERQGRAVRVQGLRPEFDALFRLVASRMPGMRNGAPRPGLLERAGRRLLSGLSGALGLLDFVGRCAQGMAMTLHRPSRLRWRTVLYNLQAAGYEGLPITGMLSFLLGIVIAYQGAEQLARVGANVYIADLVGLSMVRELSPLITAIIVAGRSGSAFTAQIGTMKVTEEIDALRTVGIAPMDQLVLPKMLALVLAMPLLTVYTDMMGILGGMLMARAQLGVSFTTFLDRLGEAVSLTSYLIGIGKAPVFAAIIALVGCYQGLQVTGSAESVGRQTTVSVVQSIFLVILCDALFSIVFSWLDL